VPDKSRRKSINYSIKRNLQLRLFIKVLGVAMVGIVLMATIFYFYSDMEIKNSYKMFHIHAKNFQEYLFPAAALASIAALVFAAGITLFLPISFAGPIYHIEKILKEEVAEGNLSVTCNLRQGDELGDLADALNYSLENLGNKIEAIRESAEKLESTVAGLEDPDINVKELTKKINEGLGGFRL
jgi:methyl-accepting chemotaxis protein